MYEQFGIRVGCKQANSSHQLEIYHYAIAILILSTTTHSHTTMMYYVIPP
jgi:hypothetical protein